ncbi:CDP-diacylglycerol--glycerol-3-phosphate 3-phosphatidyltransferase [Janibacter indicus]|uniref:CDP-diacylglycerol--glycerol-3-phosphate 3-phosphatidyltransferase n=1 Tax=Janibacter indicus TaxID=857417 RepID=A0A1L3MI19_9MICO|nr:MULTISPECIES: CDP-diacylglycerol--glycerol-3-phosphate 3-phosphatidyltransferase [Janibacter]APH01834.1 CDP-diacylglycerol--glycerol-3-phosphate 3-phosphatidyltransferase [Janibacter indicus]QOK21764.1 CDP-diacylglycerol--glycerol-3-phosphate 3-phosphatidyltransferase [Janibacter indicus]
MSTESTTLAPSPWNLPNALTVMRILLVPVFVWLVLRHGGDDTGTRWWAWGVFAVAIITDRIDGDLARAKGLVTDFGKVADPIADKALTGAGFITLSMIGEIPWWITVVILARELGITLMRFWVIRHGVMPASRGGKLKTFLQALAIGLFVLPLAAFPLEQLWRGLAWVILIAALVVTVATAVDYVMKALTLRSTSDRARMKRERKAAGGR